MLKKLWLPVLTVFTVMAMLLAGCAAPAPAAPAATEGEAAAPAAPAATGDIKELNVLWAQWDPADYLQQIGNMYEEKTGIKVNIVQEPWGTFGDRFFTEMAAGGDAWDMVVGDSQWLGQATSAGHYLDMTQFLTETGLKDSVTPATLTYYGEYPPGSATYWSYPTEGDANGWAYRTDLFEDPANQAAFKEKYGYDLAVPETWAQLKDMAEFFTRPDEGIYGVAIYTQKDYDAITMGFQDVLFSYGGDWADAENNVMGVTNSPEAIAALEYYKQLYECCQAPGLSNAFFAETNDSFISGQAAMAMNYFAFFPALVNPSTNPNYYDKVGFFSNPKGPDGDQHSALGGQGMSIISYISPERQQAAKDFIAWFGRQRLRPSGRRSAVTRPTKRSLPQRSS
ncbi:MAG: extracellular solute-binding protein [Anaerolineales bacterium]|nr:extracellular solute-binding protein [Anaerolineales bacterium]